VFGAKRRGVRHSPGAFPCLTPARRAKAERRRDTWHLTQSLSSRDFTTPLPPCNRDRREVRQIFLMTKTSIETAQDGHFIEVPLCKIEKRAALFSSSLIFQ